VLYETDKRKIRENREILAHQIQAGKRARPLLPGDVHCPDAGLHVVGFPGTLTRETFQNTPEFSRAP
jgi:hypothetical protein